jgi:ribosomal protein S18 acetylase RimI-like enzyme
MKNTKFLITISILKSPTMSDLEDIRALTAKLGDTFQPLSKKDLHGIINSPTAYLFIAREPKKKKIVGMGTLAIFRIPYLKKAYLDDFIVSDDYQGQGIGSLLMKSVIEKAKEEEVAYMEFTSNPTRIGANKFYQKMGFAKRETNVYRMSFDNEK